MCIRDSRNPGRPGVSEQDHHDRVIEGAPSRDLRRQRRSATSDAGCLEPADRQSEGVTLRTGGHEREGGGRHTGPGSQVAQGRSDEVRGDGDLQQTVGAGRHRVDPVVAAQGGGQRTRVHLGAPSLGLSLIHI